MSVEFELALTLSAVFIENLITLRKFSSQLNSPTQIVILSHIFYVFCGSFISYSYYSYYEDKVENGIQLLILTLFLCLPPSVYYDYIKAESKTYCYSERFSIGNELKRLIQSMLNANVFVIFSLCLREQLFLTCYLINAFSGILSICFLSLACKYCIHYGSKSVSDGVLQTVFEDPSREHAHLLKETALIFPFMVIFGIVTAVVANDNPARFGSLFLCSVTWLRLLHTILFETFDAKLPEDANLDDDDDEEPIGYPIAERKLSPAARCKDFFTRQLSKSFSKAFKTGKREDDQPDLLDLLRTTQVKIDDNPTMIDQANAADNCDVDDIPIEATLKKSPSSISLPDSRPQWFYDLSTSNQTIRSIDQCEQLASTGSFGELSNTEILLLINNKKLALNQLEKILKNSLRATCVRRMWLRAQFPSDINLDSIPLMHYDFGPVTGACCENVIGYLPVPLGYAGPIEVNGRRYFVPMATTEGCLIASTSRGCKAVVEAGGVKAYVYGDCMTRGPVVKMPDCGQAVYVTSWLKRKENYAMLKSQFDVTSRFAKLQRIQANLAGRYVYMRFEATCGDAMGMNMVTKATEHALSWLIREHFPNMELISISGNFCTDKKPAALNWINGRGRSVVAEATIPARIVTSVLKTTVPSMIELNSAKNMIGSALAGASAGGCNAHSSNVVTAIYLATGQDVAQNVSSSACITVLETAPNGFDLYITCTLPCLELGTVGGGTILEPQKACLRMLGCQGSSIAREGENARQLAEIVAATVLAGELSLIAALSAGHLVQSHMKHNRSSQSLVCLQNVEFKIEQTGAAVEDNIRELMKDPRLKPECSKVLT